MFDLFRNNTKVLMGFLVLLIIPSFIFFGIDGYSQFNARENEVAVVQGQKITQADWDQANDRAAARLRGQNPDIDLALFDTPEMKYSVLEQLVRERVMLAAARDSHLAVSDAKLATYLSQDPTIASMRGPDGKLNMEAYAGMLAGQNLTPAAFEAGVRQDLSAQQVMLGVADSSFAPSAQADVTLSALRQVRNIQYFLLKPEQYADKVTADEAAMMAYYKEKEALFKRPESADIEYVELTVDALKASISASDADLQTYYEANLTRLGTPEERKASHILIEAPKGMPEAERAKAKAKAAAIHAELVKNPSSFAEVAKRESQDAASAPQGGDLGFFTASGASVVDDISKAAFALKAKGDISAVIDADFGFDIVQLTDIKPSQAPAFDEIRAKLEEQYRTEQAQKMFSANADEMGKIAFEQRDSLKPIADKFKLPIKTATGFVNDRIQPATVPAELGAPDLVVAVFDAAVDKGNTQPIPITPTHMVVARVTKHQPARTEAFDAVRDQVRSLYVAQESAKLARDAAKAQLDAVRKSPATANWLPALDVSREKTGGVPEAVLEAALRAETKQLPNISVVDLGAQGAAILQVNKVVAPEALPAEAKKQAEQQYAMGWSRAEMEAYYNMLKDRFKVKISAADPKKQAQQEKADK